MENTTEESQVYHEEGAWEWLCLFFRLYEHLLLCLKVMLILANTCMSSLNFLSQPTMNTASLLNLLVSRLVSKLPFLHSLGYNTCTISQSISLLLFFFYFNSDFTDDSLFFPVPLSDFCNPSFMTSLCRQCPKPLGVTKAVIMIVKM